MPDLGSRIKNEYEQSHEAGTMSIPYLREIMLIIALAAGGGLGWIVLRSVLDDRAGYLAKAEWWLVWGIPMAVFAIIVVAIGRIALRKQRATAVSSSGAEPQGRVATKTSVPGKRRAVWVIILTVVGIVAFAALKPEAFKDFFAGAKGIFGMLFWGALGITLLAALISGKVRLKSAIAAVVTFTLCFLFLWEFSPEVFTFVPGFKETAEKRVQTVRAWEAASQRARLAGRERQSVSWRKVVGAPVHRYSPMVEFPRGAHFDARDASMRRFVTVLTKKGETFSLDGAGPRDTGGAAAFMSTADRPIEIVITK